MRRTSLTTILVLVAGPGIGFLTGIAATLTLQRKDTHRADLAAIEKLHRADVEATLTQDPSYLNTLWSEDAVNLVFPTPAVGVKAVQEGFAKFRAEYPDFKVLKYEPKYKEVRVVDGWAIEVGHYETTFKMSANGKTVSMEGEAMRVLKRQSDGSWKFAVVGLK
jgi:uncharacterized protein (TIGR02246 family)